MCNALDFETVKNNFKASFDGKKKSTKDLSKYASNNKVPYGWVESAYYDVEPLPAPETILRIIEKLNSNGKFFVKNSELDAQFVKLDKLYETMERSIKRAYEKGKTISKEVFEYNNGRFANLKQ